MDKLGKKGVVLESMPKQNPIIDVPVEACDSVHNNLSKWERQIRVDVWSMRVFPFFLTPYRSTTARLDVDLTD